MGEVWSRGAKYKEHQNDKDDEEGVRFHCNVPLLFDDISRDKTQCYKLHSSPFIEDDGCDTSPIPHALYRDTQISRSDVVKFKQPTFVHFLFLLCCQHLGENDGECKSKLGILGVVYKPVI